MSKDTSDENTTAEEEYEVERIVGHKVIRYRKQRKFSYFIKWLNYPDADNTWEKEDNVFAVNMIAAYWNGIPPSDPDRILFEQLQAKKKDPIILDTPPPQPKVAKVISHASPSPPSSPTLKPTTEVTTEEPKRNTISTMFTSFLSGSKKKDTIEKTASSSSNGSSVASSSKAPVIQEQKKIDELYKKVPSPTTTPPINGSVRGKERESGVTPKPPTPIIVDKLNSDDQDFSPSTTSATNSSTDDLEAEVEVEDVESAEDMVVEVDEDEDEDDEVVKRPSRSATRKRTRSTYTDYFIEQHKKKKLYGDKKDTEDDDDEDDGSIASSIDSNDKKKSDNLKPTDTIIIDDSFSKDASLDWNKLAKKVEYIGREVENGPIYCVVSWEDEVRSFHSLDLVRKKRPDLVIDAFVALL